METKQLREKLEEYVKDRLRDVIYDLKKYERVREYEKHPRKECFSTFSDVIKYMGVRNDAIKLGIDVTGFDESFEEGLLKLGRRNAVPLKFEGATEIYRIESEERQRD